MLVEETGEVFVYPASTSKLLQKFQYSEERSFFSVFLCIYTIETKCGDWDAKGQWKTLPFVKYVVQENSFPSFVLDTSTMDENIDPDVYFKNECFCRVLKWIQNIHQTKLNFEKIYKGYWMDSDENIYFFCDLSSLTFKPNARFCIIDEIVEKRHVFIGGEFLPIDPLIVDLFIHCPAELLYILGERKEKIDVPRLYYSYYSDNHGTMERHNDPLYGDFFYFSETPNGSIHHQVREKTIPKYAVFLQDSLSEGEDEKPCELSMFSFMHQPQADSEKQHNISLLCVKSMLHFYSV
jgi:hypothetical protein